MYDDLGRLVESTNAEGKVTRYEYDAGDNLIKIRDPKGNITTFEYNELNLVKKKTYADGKYEEYTYYTDGLVHTKKNARGTTATYGYDDFGKIVSITYDDTPPTPTVSYTYDDNFDRLTARTDGVGAYSYTYDENTLVRTEDWPWDNDALTYSYDAVGRVGKIEQQGADTVNYPYDTDGRLTDVIAGTAPSTRTFHYVYTGGNQVPDSLTRPNGSFTTYLYDYIYRLKEIRNKKSDNSEICSNLFTYDKAHMKVQEVINTNEANGYLPNKVFAYNNVNQLTTSGYAYDADGNMTNGFTPDNYPFTATYDAENRLKTISYTDPKGTHTATFTHNADGFIGKQVVDGVETRFIYDNQYNVLQERNSSNAVTRSYVWDPTAPGGIGGLLEMTQNGQHYNYLYDGKGNVSAVTDSNQAVVASYKNDAFGNLISKSGSLDQPYMFSTKRYYSGYGFSDFGLRQYLLNRWMTRDQIGEVGGLNLYGMVFNNPINRIDDYGNAASNVPATGPVNGNESYPSGNNYGTTLAGIPGVVDNWMRTGSLIIFSKKTRYPQEYSDCYNCHHPKNTCLKCHGCRSKDGLFMPCDDCHKGNYLYYKQGK